MRLVQKTRVKLFRLSFSTGSASRNSQSKKVESKKPFFDCVRKLYLGFCRKRPFSTDKSDCVRNGLSKTYMFHAACAVEFRPFNRLYSQLTFFIYFILKNVSCEYDRLNGIHFYQAKSRLCVLSSH